MKSKKLLLGSLSAMALVATPIAAVVSCSKNDDKIAKTTTKGFVVQGIYIPEALASKAGSFTMKAEGNKESTVTWDKALKAGEKVKLKTGTEAEKEFAVTAADDKHFVLPMKGKSGVGQYLDKENIKNGLFESLLNEGELNLDPKVEADKVAEIGINDINAFLAATELKVESATAKKIAGTKDRPEHYKFTLVWKK